MNSKLIYLLALISLWCFGSNSLASERLATAFYYGNQLPLKSLSLYSRVIVEPDNTTDAELQYLKQKGVHVYAYISIGEVGPDRPWIKDIDPAWILGINSGWKSSVMDMSQSAWRSYLLKIMDKLWSRGYEGFFLDTLDSYLVSG